MSPAWTAKIILLLVGFSGSFAPYPFSAIEGRHDDEDVISLARPSVNNLNPQCSPNVV